MSAIRERSQRRTSSKACLLFLRNLAQKSDLVYYDPESGYRSSRRPRDPYRIEIHELGMKRLTRLMRKVSQARFFHHTRAIHRKPSFRELSSPHFSASVLLSTSDWRCRVTAYRTRSLLFLFLPSLSLLLLLHSLVILEPSLLYRTSTLIYQLEDVSLHRPLEPDLDRQLPRPSRSTRR